MRQLAYRHLATTVRLPRLYARARAACSYGAARGIPGVEFAEFGRRLGWRLLRRGLSSGVGYLLTPVNIVRYFEFPFALANVPATATECLDLSSPRLFSLYVATYFPARTITMLNPDLGDLTHTRAVISRLGIRNVRTLAQDVGTLAEMPGHYDCIWSISVVEHIHDKHDDTAAMRLLYGALAEGGRLILTVPVDRAFREEYRGQNIYGTQAPCPDGSYFFQRIYDEATIKRRLLDPIGQPATCLRWFGETRRGLYVDYERRWLEQAQACSVDDPREIADHFREFPSWEAMPGMGVCGLVVAKRKRRNGTEIT